MMKKRVYYNTIKAFPFEGDQSRVTWFSGGGFSPSDLNPLFWARADTDVTKDVSDKVSQWDNQGSFQTGVGASVTQGTGASQPTFVSGGFGGEDTLNFDGGDSLGQYDATSDNADYFTGGRDVTIALCFNTSSTVANQSLFNFHSGANSERLSIRIQSGGTMRITWSRTGSGSGTYDVPAFTVATNTNYYVVISFSQTSNHFNLWVNGTQRATNQSLGLSGGLDYHGLIIGAKWDGSPALTGDMPEFFVSDELTDSDRGDLETYFANRYGI